MLGARGRSSQRGNVRGWHADVWLAIALAIATAQCASAKGFISFPPSRKMMVLEAGNRPLPNNAGGAELEFHKGHGLCGALGKDADLDVNATISPNAFFTEGDVIDVDVTLESRRKGHFEFRLCSLDANDFSQECLNEHVLKFDATFTAASYSGQMEDAMRWSPADLLENEACKSDDGTPLGSCCNHGGACTDGAHNRHRWTVPSSAAGPMYTMRLVLPRGVRCEHCVLQWFYQTGDGRGSFHGYPEGFWDCADVAIREKTVLVPSEVQRRKLLAILPASAKARELGSDDSDVEVGIDLSLLGETTSAPTNAPSFASTSAPTTDQAQMPSSNETSIDDEVSDDGSGSVNVDDDEDKSEDDATSSAATVSTALIVGASVSAAGAVLMLVALLRMRHKRSHGVLEAIPVSLHAEGPVNAYPSSLSRVRGLFSRSRATDRHAFTAKEVEAVVIESPVDH